MKINMDSIIKKSNKYLSSNAGKKQISSAVDSMMLSGGSVSPSKRRATTHTPEEAARKFIEVLKDDISSSGMGPTAVEALSDLGCSNPQKTGYNAYTIEVNFLGDLRRKSLQPEVYGGIDNIAALLNNGYTARRAVHGKWHGDEIFSLPVRTGTYFLDSAAFKFLAEYGAEYGVDSITIDDEYK